MKSEIKWKIFFLLPFIVGTMSCFFYYWLSQNLRTGIHYIDDVGNGPFLCVIQSLLMFLYAIVVLMRLKEMTKDGSAVTAAWLLMAAQVFPPLIVVGMGIAIIAVLYRYFTEPLDCKAETKPM